MANLSVQKNENDKPIVQQPREWPSTRLLREFLNWDPFAELVPAPLAGFQGFAPAFEVKESTDGFVIKADVPGVKEEDLEVKVSNSRLVVSGKRESEKTEKGETFYTHERSYGSFTRSFTLPEGVDGARIKADLKEGVLTIELPRRPEAQPRTIAVKSS